MGSQLLRARRTLGDGFILVRSEKSEGVEGFERAITSFGKTWPAITPGYKTDVEDEEKGKEIVCYGNSYRCTGEAPIELLGMLEAALSKARRGK